MKNALLLISVDTNDGDKTGKERSAIVGEMLPFNLLFENKFTGMDHLEFVPIKLYVIKIICVT